MAGGSSHVLYGRRECTVSLEVYLDDRPETMRILRGGPGRQHVLDIFFGDQRFTAKAFMGEASINPGGSFGPWGAGHSVTASIEFLVLGDPVYQDRHRPITVVARLSREDLAGQLALRARHAGAAVLPGDPSLLDAILDRKRTGGRLLTPEQLEDIVVRPPNAFLETVLAVGEARNQGLSISDNPQPQETDTMNNRAVVYQFTAVHCPEGGAPQLLDFDGDSVVTVAIPVKTRDHDAAVKLEALKRIATLHADVPADDLEISVRPFYR